MSGARGRDALRHIQGTEAFSDARLMFGSDGLQEDLAQIADDAQLLHDRLFELPGAEA